MNSVCTDACTDADDSAIAIAVGARVGVGVGDHWVIAGPDAAIAGHSASRHAGMVAGRGRTGGRSSDAGRS